MAVYHNMSLHVNRLLVTLSFWYAIFISICDGHSLLMEPRPYGVQCPGCGACPPFIRWYDIPGKNGKWSMWHDGTTTWKRGSTVTIRWEKNNHNGGFVRLSLVPEHQMFNRSAHTHLAFYYTCWEQGLYICGSGLCGSDTSRHAFRRHIKIPDIIPDGDYLLGFLWYGGLHWQRQHGRFSDYTSCARVRIKGGVQLNEVDSIKAYYDEGPGNKNKYGTCLTSATAPGECLHGCTHIRAGYHKPWLFSKYGHQYLPRLKAKDYQQTNVNMTGPLLKKHYARDPGICAANHSACCASSCTVCQQEGCELRTGGEQLCCPKKIQSSGRRCRSFGAPCKLSFWCLWRIDTVSLTNDNSVLKL